MIPKIIHYVWLGGKEMPKEYQEYIAGWKKLMPDYQFMEWNESNFDFSASKYAVQAYENKKFGFVADYIRVCVLEKYGGIYLDTDVEVLKRFDELLDNDFFTCFENDAYIETAVLGSVPHHPFLSDLKRFYEKHEFIKNGNPDLTPSPLFFTYFLIKDFGFKMKPGKQVLTAEGKESLTIFEREYFAPIDYTTGKQNVTPNTFAIHHFSASWVGKKQKFEHALTNFALKVFGRKTFASFTRRYVKNVTRKIWKEDKKGKYSLLAQNDNKT